MVTFKAIDIDGKETPPMDLNGLAYLQSIGRLNGKNLIRQNEDDKWIPLEFIAEGAKPTPITQVAIFQSKSQEPAPDAPLTTPPPIPFAPLPPVPILAPTPRSVTPVQRTIPDGYGYASQPWSRLWAYWVDSLILGLIGSIAIGVTIGLMGVLSYVGESTVRSLDLVLSILAAWSFVPIGIGLSEALFGTTPGKLLFGLRVWRPDGSNPKIMAAVKRNYSVLFNGLWGALPLVSLIAANEFLKNLNKGHRPDWDTDESLAFQYKPERNRIWLMWIVALFGLIFMGITKLVLTAMNQPSVDGF